MYNNNSNFLPFGYNVPFFDYNNNSIVRVNGLEGAKQFQMRANNMCALFDNNDNVFYIKSTDGAGFASYRKFRYTEEPAESSVNYEQYVTKEEFNKLMELVKNGNVSVSDAE